MNSARLGIILQRLRRVAPPSAESDAALLSRFAQGEQAAFATLVDRYSSLVWAVGRRILRKQQDAEDVFQAAFLALSRKANSLRAGHSLAPWLYTVTVHLALKIRGRQSRETYLMDIPEPATLADPSLEIVGRELAQAFDEEMARLPEKYREALILCCLEGKTRDEATGMVGCSLGALKNRLERARKLLRNRLERRGIVVPTTLLLVGLTNRRVPAAVCAVAAHITQTASPAVVALVGEVIGGGMMMKTIILTVALGLTAVGIGIGSRLLADPEPAPKTPLAAAVVQVKPPTKEQPAKEQPAENEKPRLDNFGDPLPEDALARFGTVRLRSGNIINILYSPDEKTMAIAGFLRPLGLWDLASGKELFRFVSPDGDEPYCIAFSPDGKILAEGGGNGAVRLWDTQTGKLIRAFKGGAHTAAELIFSPDGRALISVEFQTIHFWDVDTGEETAKIELPVGYMYGLALSNDGKLLAAGGYDKTVRVWDAKSRELLKEFRGAKGMITKLSFSPDGKHLASSAYSGPCLVWDVSKGEVTHKLGGDSEKFGEPENVAYSPSGKWLVTGFRNGMIRLWNPETGTEIRHWETQSTLNSRTVRFSRDSKTIATSSSSENTVRFWEVETGKEIQPADVHSAAVYGLRLSADGKSLWSLSRDQRIIRWDTTSGKPDEAIPFPWDNNVFPALSPCEPILAWASTSDRMIHVMDLKTGKDACPPFKIETAGDSLAYKMLRFSPDGKLLSFNWDEKHFYLWKWQTERNPKALKSPTSTDILPVFSPDGKHIVTHSRKPQGLDWWDIDSGEKQFSFSDKDDSNLYPMAISPDARWLVSTIDMPNVMNQQPATTDSKRIHVFDIEKRSKARVITGGALGRGEMAFSPDGHVLAYSEVEGHNSSQVKLIEFISGETIATWKGHQGEIHPFQFSPDGRTLYSGAGDSTILKWDATARHGKGPSTPDLAAAWDALALEASKAYPARWDLVDAPKETMTLLRKRMVPEKVDPEEVQQLVEDLDADEFRKREKASQSLKSMGFSADGLLQKALEREKRPEVRERLQKIIDELKGVSFLRMQRGMQVLETINNEESRKLLGELAEGPAESMLTKEAKTVLKRMERVASGE